MTKLLMFFMILSISLFMLFLNNPLFMGLMILFQTILISLLSGMLIKTYWFFYILFLTFLGGLLVLFIYVFSIASKELFKPSFNSKVLFFFSLLLLLLLILFKKKNFYWMNFFFNFDMNNFFLMNMFFFNNDNKIVLNKLYNNQTFMIMLILIIYLFITLIAVVKITNIFYGPLRFNIT
uniref:NADH dehydrogenase subunit 6 n=1 Tax=Colobochyla salicalis TaxID=938222 RepID=UPI00226C6AFA|nr:NADH dehydrogenase subunit 6 [Colobochyla salicalis]UYX62286.1 NADH dehydrogenase subunit 6 [Colobochyla salicalis]